MKKWAFDFFGTLAYPGHEDVRALARELHAAGDEVHIVSAISPEIPWDYPGDLARLNVPWTAVWRTDHAPGEKVEVLKKIEAAGFWDDTEAYVAAARAANIPSCLVDGKHQVMELSY